MRRSLRGVVANRQRLRAGDAEAGQFYAAALRAGGRRADEHILRAHISMRDPARLRVFERFSDGEWQPRSAAAS